MVIGHDHFHLQLAHFLHFRCAGHHAAAFGHRRVAGRHVFRLAGGGILNLDQASEQVLAVLAYGRKLPEADPGRIVLVGWSWGGFLSLGVAAMNPPGVVAVINFAGGFGGLGELWRHADMGRRVRVPTLWLYTENDRPFPAAYGEAWAKAFAADGGKVDYRLLPAFGEDGHFLFPDGSAIWMPLVEAFLERAGFKLPLPE